VQQQAPGGGGTKGAGAKGANTEGKRPPAAAGGDKKRAKRA